ncbi:MAG: ABC transporter ATP-binding protein [Sphingobacteriales bacterium]|nr:MAG: ABC transporter ATP-binding protein [Sphingobacteriales bacterium]
MNPVLEVRHLTKKYPTHLAVDDLSFRVMPGEVYGFLGENGAGKSTTLRCILGLIRPTTGEILIAGQPFPKSGISLLRRIGAVVERPDMYSYFTGLENLRLFARLCDATIPESRLDEVLTLVGLKDRMHDRVKAYSLGMKQRLGIAIALVHEPDLLILDEPTNGLDPQGIADIRNLILHLSRDLGKTVIISSHLLAEIENVATRLLILHKGKKMLEGAYEELVRPSETRVLIQLATPFPELRQAGLSWNAEQGSNPQQLVFRTEATAVPELIRQLAQQGAAIQSVQTRHSLEDLFLSLTAS